MKHPVYVCVCINRLSCLYSLFQPFIYIKSEFIISVPNVRLQAVIIHFQIFKNNLLTYNKTCNVPFIGLLEMNVSFITSSPALRCVIPIACVTNEREESVFNQHNLFRKMLYSNNATTCFGL